MTSFIVRITIQHTCFTFRVTRSNLDQRLTEVPEFSAAGGVGLISVNVFYVTTYVQYVRPYVGAGL